MSKHIWEDDDAFFDSDYEGYDDDAWTADTPALGRQRVELLKEQMWLKKQLEDYDDYPDEWAGH